MFFQILYTERKSLGLITYHFVEFKKSMGFITNKNNIILY